MYIFPMTCSSFNLILTIELTKVKSSLEETADDNDNKNPFL